MEPLETARTRPDAAVDFDTILLTNGLDGDTLIANVPGTLHPPDERPATRDHDAVAALPSFTFGLSAGAELDLKDTIGQGGMGIVRVATQVPLQRDVAVKSVRPDRAMPESTLALLREAWVTGGLEHPNVVPVHTLGLDEDGGPLLVMKRIEGEAWSDLLHGRKSASGASAGLARQSDVDPLGRHLDILVQVGHAVAFAHSKGIVHRDLKPENVMVGRFGEVYVLDWGLAVAMDADPRRVPLARDIRGIAGTPQYMAPEMVTGDGSAIGPRTDVYLLGAILHEILTGRMRHQGDTLAAVLYAAHCSEPYAYPPDVPEALAQLATKACAPHPADRHADAGEFRRDLQRFLDRRHALDVAATAQDRLRELQQALAEVVPEATPDEALATEARIARAFSECRFGFQLALGEWPGHEAAQDGLRACLLTMALAECRRGHLHAAELLATELGTPDGELQTAMAELRILEAQKAADLALLHKMERDADPAIGSRTRAFLSLVMGVVYAALPLGIRFGISRGWCSHSHAVNLFVAFAYSVLLVLGYFWARDTLNRTEINRRFVRAMAVLSVAFWVSALGGWQMGVTPGQALTNTMLLAALFLGVMGATLDARLLVAPMPWVVAYLAATRWPQHVFELAAAGNLVGSFAAAAAWKPGKDYVDARKMGPV